MNDSNAQLFLMAQAEMVRVEGMKAENLRRTNDGGEACYMDGDFDNSARAIEGFAQQFTFDE